MIETDNVAEVKFDSACSNWSRDPEINVLFLRTVQNWLNDSLRSRGHVFLNEVYDQLGMPRTTQGAIVGWLSEQGELLFEQGPIDDEGGIPIVLKTHGTIYDKIES